MMVVSWWGCALLGFLPLIDWSALGRIHGGGLALSERVIRDSTAAAEYPYVTK